MSNLEITQPLLELETKLFTLLRKFKALKESHAKLEEENEFLRMELENKKKELDNFQNQPNLTKLVDGISAENRDTTELKRIISDYIKEIDLCIAQLSD